MPHQSELLIDYWTMDGAYYKDSDICKLDDLDIINRFQKNDIVCLVETHCNDDQKPEIDGFAPPISNVRPRTPGAPYNSGGILIYIKSAIRKGISVLPQSNSEYRWLKLNRSFFKLPYDLYLAVIYISNGSFAEKSDDIFELIENDIASFSKDGSQFILCGYFNARTNNETDYCISENSNTLNKHLDLPFSLVDDIPIPRSNSDTQKCNGRGERLLQLCKSTDLRILNGRFFLDTNGRFTCYSYTGKPSTIDYILSSTSLMDKVKYLMVNELTVYSIHCSISTCFSIDRQVNYDQCHRSQYEAMKKFIWSRGDTELFQESIASEKVFRELDDLFKTFQNPNNTNESPEKTYRYSI